MKNRTLLTMLALTAVFSLTMTGCFGEQKEEVVVEESTFPEDTKEEEAEATPTPEPTTAPDVQTTTYLSKNKQISIQLPDATWLNKTDEDDLYTFESKDQGSILITHASGEEMAEAALPDSETNATAIEEAAELNAGTDFELTDYQAEEDANGNFTYSYQVKMLDAEKAGYAYVIVKVYANETEDFNIRGTVKTDDADTLEKIKTAIDSVGLSEDSTLEALAPMPEEITAMAADDTAQSDGTEGVQTDAETSDSENSEASDDSNADGGENTIQGITPSRDNPDNTDTNLTRTIYRNSDGHPIVISADSNGNWVDEYGNVYRFADNEIDVYDQDDVDYYWHGEAADVYYMPVE